MEMQIAPQVGCCEAIKLAFKNYVKCSGRSRRSEFWYFHLFVYCIIFGLYFIMIILETSQSSYEERSVNSSAVVVYCMLLLFIIIVFIPHISVSVRRLHDTGKSGFFYLVNFIPFVGGLILLYLCSVDSEQNTNEYGPSPKYILPQNEALNQNNNGYGIPVNPYPQSNQMQPQVSPYPQPMPPQVSPYPQPNQMPPQVSPYPQPMPPQVSPYPQPNQMAPQVNPYPQPMPPQVSPYPPVSPNP